MVTWAIGRVLVGTLSIMENRMYDPRASAPKGTPPALGKA